MICAISTQAQAYFTSEKLKIKFCLGSYLLISTCKRLTRKEELQWKQTKTKRKLLNCFDKSHLSQGAAPLHSRTVTIQTKKLEVQTNCFTPAWRTSHFLKEILPVNNNHSIQVKFVHNHLIYSNCSAKIYDIQ